MEIGDVKKVLFFHISNNSQIHSAYALLFVITADRSFFFFLHRYLGFETKLFQVLGAPHYILVFVILLGFHTHKPKNINKRWPGLHTSKFTFYTVSCIIVTEILELLYWLCGWWIVAVKTSSCFRKADNIYLWFN